MSKLSSTIFINQDRKRKKMHRDVKGKSHDMSGKYCSCNTILAFHIMQYDTSVTTQITGITTEDQYHQEQCHTPDT